MSLGRLRRGELVLLVALVLLLIGLSVRWFDVVVPSQGGSEIRGGGRSGWATLGHPWIELVVVALLVWVATLVSAARSGGGRPTYAAVLIGVWAVLVSVLVLVLTLLRSVVFPPSWEDVLVAQVAVLFDEPGRPATGFDVALAGGGWVGLAALLLGLVGAWMAMADDRTTAPESRAVQPPPVREVPPPRPATDTGTPVDGEPGQAPPEPG